MYNPLYNSAVTESEVKYFPFNRKLYRGLLPENFISELSDNKTDDALSPVSVEKLNPEKC